ncbi:hypothetical protein [Halorientalis salina]|nr:hypothetical protein [Halorientalis salina]
MSGLERYDCDNCEKAFKAHSASNAAANAYCSPNCESEGKGF